MTHSEATQDSAKNLHSRRFDVLYRMRLSALYHQKRERFFDLLDKIVSGLLAMFATAAFTTLFQATDDHGKAVAAITAALSLIPLVFNPAQKARHHNQLAQDYRRLLADCELLGEEWPEADCNRISARSLHIAAAEPTPLSALVADCQNQLALAFDEKEVADMKWHHHLFKHVLDLRPKPLTQD